MCDGMNEKEMVRELIDEFTNLQRIKNADNPETEVEYQLKIVKAKLESCGIVTSDLEIKK